MVIKHNMQSENTNRQFNIVSKSLSSSTEKLSSGYKINRAADDAAGLSISEKMRKQIRGLTKASANAEDGISMIQIADGALEEVHDMLQRINVLSVQSANGTNSETDRAYIQDEVDQIKKEIDRVAETTKFNEIYLLKGEKPSFSFTEIQASRPEEVDLDDWTPNSSSANGVQARQLSLEEMNSLDGVKIFYTDGVVTTETGQEPVTPAYTPRQQALANTLKTSIVPQAVMSFINSMDAFDYLKDSTIGIGLKIYEDTTSNTLAYVTVGWSQIGSSVVSNYLSYNLSVNTNTLVFDASDNLTETSRNDLEVTIIHEMMHAYMDESLTNGMVGVTNGTKDSNDFPSWFKEGMAQLVAGPAYSGNDWIRNSLRLSSTSTYDDIKNVLTGQYSIKNSDSTNGTIQGRSRYGTGAIASMYLAYQAGTGSNLQSRLTNGADVILTSLMNGSSLEELVTKYTDYTSLSEFENKFGSKTEEQDVVSRYLRAIGTNGTGGLLTGLTNETNGILSNADLSGVTLFQLNTDYFTVGNEYPAGYTVFSGGNATRSGTRTPGDHTVSTGDEVKKLSEIIYAFVQPRDATEILLHIGADSDRSNKLKVHIDSMNCSGLGIAALDVSNAENATHAIDLISEAIQRVSSQRSKLGAYQNRLEHSIKNLDNVVENTTASESQIRDTDMASEMVKYSNSQILSQAGQSMLSQTKNSNQGILNLLA